MSACSSGSSSSSSPTAPSIAGVVRRRQRRAGQAPARPAAARPAAVARDHDQLEHVLQLLDPEQQARHSCWRTARSSPSAITAFASSPLAPRCRPRWIPSRVTSATKATVKYDLTAAGTTVASGADRDLGAPGRHVEGRRRRLLRPAQPRRSRADERPGARRHATQQAEPAARGRQRAAGATGPTRSRSPRSALLLFLTFLDNTIVSVGLGSLQTDLQASVADLQWVVGGYALTFAAHHAGLRHDRRRARPQEGHARPAPASSAPARCSAPSRPTPQALIAGRAIMGLGAAASEPGTLSVLRHIYTDDRARAWAVGVWAAVVRARARPRPGDRRRASSARGAGAASSGSTCSSASPRCIVAAVTVPESSDPTAARVDIAGHASSARARSPRSCSRSSTRRRRASPPPR